MKAPPYFVPHGARGRALVLDDVDDYDAFPGIVALWAEKLGIEIIERVDGPDARAWKGKIHKSVLWFVYDDLLADLRLVPEGESALHELERFSDRLLTNAPKG